MNIFQKLLYITCVVALTSSNLLAEKLEILNVSYDPTREFYQEVNKLFSNYWEEKTGSEVIIRQSHGGAGKQARAVIDGLEADVVTLALAYDIDMIAKLTKAFPANWQKRLPYNSCPYSSTIVFLIRKGNPKNITDWNDLIRPNVSVITPNPKTSGGARWNYLAAWAYAEKFYKNDKNKIHEFMKKLYRNVPVLDTGARGSTTTFVQRGIGDVLLAWENEALLAIHKLKKNDFDIVIPSVSILAEPPVTYLDVYNKKHKTEKAAKAYLDFLYTEPIQELIGKHFYRPRSKQAMQKYASQFPEVTMVSVDKAFGGWQTAQEKHFNDGELFDLIYEPGN